MKRLADVKAYLDDLVEIVPAAIAGEYVLEEASLVESDCQAIESELDIKLPTKYRKALLAYDWSRFRLENMRFYAKPTEIVRNNRHESNPYYDFYERRGFLEIGVYEADRILIRVGDGSGRRGSIHYLDHTRLPVVVVEPVAEDFVTLIVCSTIVLRKKMESGFFPIRKEMDDEAKEALFNRILAEITLVEPLAKSSSFWSNFVRGY